MQTRPLSCNQLRTHPTHTAMMVETENLPGSKSMSEIESITAVTWWGDYRDLRNKKQWNTVKILWIEFQYYSTSGPSAQAFLLLGVEELGSPPQSPTSSSLRTGANRRNASRCQEAVKCWRGGQRAFTHMWLYFHNSILPFLPFSVICSLFFSCHIFLFPDSAPPFIILLPTWRFRCGPSSPVSAPTGCLLYCRASSQN